tara:strand:- start:1080 stop:1307 length:228 start_codon:yes stop_codon:yes gene_type:complete
VTDPLRQPLSGPLGFTERLSKHKALTGLKARIRWYERVMSFVGLMVLVGIIGLLLALSVGLLAIGGRVLLDVIVS